MVLAIRKKSFRSDDKEGCQISVGKSSILHDEKGRRERDKGIDGRRGGRERSRKNNDVR